MGATLTHERRRYSCRLYMIDPQGYTRCGACWAAAGHSLKDCRAFDLQFDGLPLPARVGVDPDGPRDSCETCGADPQQFRWYEDDAIVTIEYVPCRIF